MQCRAKRVQHQHHDVLDAYSFLFDYECPGGPTCRRVLHLVLMNLSYYNRHLMVYKGYTFREV
jgi:hypothetical protein